MRIDTAGIDLIRNLEGCRLHAYPDPGTGAAPWTIGFGCTEGVTEGMEITEVEAEAMLSRHLEPLQVHLDDLIQVSVSQNQWDAIISLVFNIGVGSFRKSALLKALNAGEFAQAADEFLKWNKSGGKVMDGLAKRRAAERDLFLKA